MTEGHETPRTQVISTTGSAVVAVTGVLGTTGTSDGTSLSERSISMEMAATTCLVAQRLLPEKKRGVATHVGLVAATVVEDSPMWARQAAVKVLLTFAMEHERRGNVATFCFIYYFI